SATIQVWAGPSGIGTEPIGCLLSADAVPVLTVAPKVTTVSTAAAAAMSFRMGAKFNFHACLSPISPPRSPHGHQGGTGAERQGRQQIRGLHRHRRTRSRSP